MGTQKNVDMSISPEEMADIKEGPETEADKDSQKDSTDKPVQKRERSQKYKQAKSYVDRTKYYKLKKAIDIVFRASYSNFEGTIVADGTVRDPKLNLETTFPNPTGKTVKVAIATDATLKKVERGDIDFDILLATPKQMPNVAKHARILGPQGLMPNPKNNTVVDNPEGRKKELESGKIQISTERKAPLIHVVVGQTDQPQAEIVENVKHLITTIGPKKLKKLTLSATMSPGVKIDLTEFQTS